MKTQLYTLGIFLSSLLIGCHDQEELHIPEPPALETPSDIPGDHFIVTFATPSRAAIIGADSRVQSLLYILYKETGEYVKERIILTPSGSKPSWPLYTLRDTLPKGNYKAIFLANTEKTLFPYATPGIPVNISNILVNYKTTYSNARLYLPNVEFKDSTEYYWAKVPFSNTNTTPSVLLQRILGKLNVHRNTVDAQQALNTLVNNIVVQMNYKNVIRTQAKNILTTEIKAALGPVGTLLLAPLGGITTATDTIVGRVLTPVVNTLYTQLLQGLVNQLGIALVGNSDQNTLIEKLGILLNPWEFNEANTAIITLKNFPKSINLDLVVQEYYTDTQKFAYRFSTDNYFYQKSLSIKGFSGLYNIKHINVIKQGLISGLVVDQIIDNSLLLNGTFVDISDSLTNNTSTNRRYKSDYSLVDIYLKSYDPQTGTSPLSLSVKLGNVTNLTQLLTGLPGIGPVLAIVLTPLNNITIAVPVNLPMLAISNLTISGKWSIPVAY